MPVASIGSSIESFADAVGSFADSLASIQWGSLLLGLLAFTAYLTLRSRAFFNVLRAAYPTESFRWRNVWGAYIAAYGFNGVVPARGGDVIKLFLTKSSVPRSTYPAVGAGMAVENVFDLTMSIVMIAAMTIAQNGRARRWVRLRRASTPPCRGTGSRRRAR